MRAVLGAAPTYLYLFTGLTPALTADSAWCTESTSA